jgi:hypothetical protein
MSALQLEDLPDEMLLKVFSNLKIGDLIHCGHVSRRMRKIWNIESLWQSVDLIDLDNGRGSKVKTDFIIFLLEKGCTYLNLQNVKLTGSLELDQPSKLKRLNLEDCVAKREVFEEILYSCEGNLQQLSFQDVIAKPKFDYNDVRRVILRNSKTLQKINLGRFRWLKDTSKLNFFSHCLELTEVRITADFFDIRNDQLDLMIDNFPPSLLKVDLSLCNNLTDFHIEKLVHKCNKITEISLWETDVTKQSVISIVKHLKNSLELLNLLHCDNINLDTIFEAVGSLPKLEYLHYEVHTGELSCNYSSLKKLCQSCERLKKERPGLIITDDPYSDITTVDNYDYTD